MLEELQGEVVVVDLRSHYVWVLCVSLAAAVSSTISVAHAQKTTPTPGAGPTFKRDVVPLLAKHCLKCHSGARPKGQLGLDKLLEETTARKHPEIWHKVQ